MSYSQAELIKARQEKSLADSARLEKHAIIYMKIKNGEGDELINFAKQQISLWKKTIFAVLFTKKFGSAP